jgi:hypothetical protein
MQHEIASLKKAQQPDRVEELNCDLGLAKAAGRSFVQRNDFAARFAIWAAAPEGLSCEFAFSLEWRNIATRLFLAERPARETGRVQSPPSRGLAGYDPSATRVWLEQLFPFPAPGWASCRVPGNAGL